MAQRLPVAAIPEEPHIPAMRNDVIHAAGCHLHLPMLPHAQRMRRQIRLADPLPARTIATLRRSGTLILAPPPRPAWLAVAIANQTPTPSRARPLGRKRHYSTAAIASWICAANASSE